MSSRGEDRWADVELRNDISYSVADRRIVEDAEGRVPIHARQRGSDAIGRPVIEE